jgi:hypothetical protein
MDPAGQGNHTTWAPEAWRAGKQANAVRFRLQDFSPISRNKFWPV